MIVSPDFLDHWKTRMLIDALGDNCAPIYVIRLWAHCQNRKTHILPSDNPEVTKAICQAPHDAKLFHSAMIAAGFIEVLDGKTVAHEWDSVNAYLINSWANGKKGGRPPKKTQTKPKQNPELTQSKPIREEKISNREVEEEKEPIRIGHVFESASAASVSMVEEIINCRPELRKIRPEEVFKIIHDTKSNPRQAENHKEFIAEMVNSLKVPNNPIRVYAGFMNSQGKPKPAGNKNLNEYRPTLDDFRKKGVMIC
jgi:hypothetical protein